MKTHVPHLSLGQPEIDDKMQESQCFGNDGFTDQLIQPNNKSVK
jgi:hypothetical protein